MHSCLRTYGAYLCTAHTPIAYVHNVHVHTQCIPSTISTYLDVSETIDPCLELMSYEHQSLVDEMCEKQCGTIIFSDSIKWEDREDIENISENNTDVEIEQVFSGPTAETYIKKLNSTKNLEGKKVDIIDLVDSDEDTKPSCHEGSGYETVFTQSVLTWKVMTDNLIKIDDTFLNDNTLPSDDSQDCEIIYSNGESKREVINVKCEDIESAGSRTRSHQSVETRQLSESEKSESESDSGNGVLETRAAPNRAVTKKRTKPAKNIPPARRPRRKRTRPRIRKRKTPGVHKNVAHRNKYNVFYR